MPSAMGLQTPEMRAEIDLTYNAGSGDPPPVFYQSQVTQGVAVITMTLFPQIWKTGADFTSAAATFVAQLSAAENGGNGWNTTVRDAAAITVTRVSNTVVTLTVDAPTYDVSGAPNAPYDENVVLTNPEPLIDDYEEFELSVGEALLDPTYTKLLPEDIPIGLRVSGDYHWTITPGGLTHSSPARRRRHWAALLVR